VAESVTETRIVAIALAERKAQLGEVFAALPRVD
jgi:hypothetical protein